MKKAACFSSLLVLVFAIASCAVSGHGGKATTVETVKGEAKTLSEPVVSKSSQTEEPANVLDVESLEIKKPVSAPEETSADNMYSFNFKEMRIAYFIKMLSDEGRNFRYVIHPSAAKRKISGLLLNGVTWREALDIVLGLYNLTSVEKNGLIVINTHDNFLSGKEFDAEHARLRSMGLKKSRSFRLKYTQPGEVRVYLENIFSLRSAGGKNAKLRKTAKSPKGKSKNRLTATVIFSVFPKASIITAYGPENILDEVGKRIAEIDLPQRQVFIEARMVDILRSHSRSLGIQWGGYYNQAGKFFPSTLGIAGGVNATAGGVDAAMVNFPATDQTQSGAVPGALNIALADALGTAQLNMRLSALEQDGKSKTLSNPKVTTINGVKARIESGREIPYQSASYYGTDTRFKKAVISLEVTPFITPDNMVNLKIIAKKQDADFTNQVQDVPSIITRTIETNVVVSDGGTTVLGGIFENLQANADTGMPGLSRIPLIGWLFKSKNKVSNEKEFLIFITPRIIKPPS